MRLANERLGPCLSEYSISNGKELARVEITLTYNVAP
jgi:hypothetical protein